MDLGKPLGPYYQKGDAYFREFEKGVVVAAPYSDTTVALESPHADLTSSAVETEFEISGGDGRVFVAVSEQ